MACAVDVHHIFACFLRGEDGLVLRGEVLELYAWGEVVHAEGGDSQRGGIVLCGDGLALHLAVVPEGALEAFLAVWGDAVSGHETLHHLVVGQVAAGFIEQFLLLGLDAVEDGDGLIGRAVVVAPHHRLVGGIGTNDGNLLLILLERQDVSVILQQDDALAGHLKRDICRLLG